MKSFAKESWTRTKDFISAKKNVEIYAFRGKGGIEGLVQAGEDARIGTGHVGISFDKGKTIYGFNPEIPATLGGKEAIAALKNGRSFKGVVSNDTAVFKRAADLGMDIRTDVIKLSRSSYNRALKNLTSDFKNSPLDVKRYSFPKRAKEAAQLGYDFEPNCYNCATYPNSIGVESPYKTGRLAEYLDR